jgi:small nuclear ribonucleoprotein (snRNP)-like protein
MSQIYLKKTEVEGLQFGVVVLAALSIKFNALRGRIERFANTVNIALDDVEKQIGARCQDTGAMDLREATIRYYDKNAVVQFTKEIICDKKQQTNIASAFFRAEIVKQIGNEQTFARANATISNDTISQILDTLIREKSIVIHDEILIENNEKLINCSILEQLNEQFRSEDD